MNPQWLLLLFVVFWLVVVLAIGLPFVRMYLRHRKRMALIASIRPDNVAEVTRMLYPNGYPK